MDQSVSMARGISITHELVRRLAAAVVVVSTFGVVAYIAWALSSQFATQTEMLIVSVGLILLGTLVFVFCLYLATSSYCASQLQRGWAFISLAFLVSMFAESLWFIYTQFLNTTAIPNLADLFHWLFYPLILAGLLLFPYTPVTRQERKTLWLDLAIVTTTGSMVIWYFIVAPYSSALEWRLSVIAGFAYPIGDLLLLAGVAILVQRDVQGIARGVLSLLAGGMFLTAVADGLAVYFEANQLPYPPHRLDILVLVSLLLYLCAVGWQIFSVPVSPTNQELKFNRSSRLIRLGLPYLAVVIGLGLLIMVIQQSNLFDVRQRGLLLGVIILVGLVLLRQYIVLRENVALFEEMRKLASTDSLTGLYNRHFFNEVFPFELKRAERHDRPLSILLIDINGFKAINDNFGHLKGDQILKLVARALAESLRGSDLIARFGGDEFIVILPETNEGSARLVAQRLKMDVGALRMENLRLGVSVGQAAYRSGISPEQLLEDADQDLYRQKTAVRGNRVSRLDHASYGHKQAMA